MVHSGRAPACVRDADISLPMATRAAFGGNGCLQPQKALACRTKRRRPDGAFITQRKRVGTPAAQLSSLVNHFGGRCSLITHL